MDTWSLGEVAWWLGVSVPTVHRGITRLGLTPDRAASGLRLGERDVKALTRDLGAVPVVDGLRRQEALVLAALAQSPLGLRTIRAVARRAGVSPTTASACLTVLEAVGLVVHERGTFAEGRAVDGGLWKVDVTGRRWLDLADTIATVVLPDPPTGPTGRRLPVRLHHLFWNAEPGRFTDPGADSYVITRLLLSDDPQAVAWVAAHGTPEALAVAARNRGADTDTRSLAANLAAAR